MRSAAIVVAIACMGLSTALADSVQIAGLPKYTDVRVTDVKNGKITFASGSTTITKNAGDIAALEITGQAVLNQAETLLKDGKLAEAIKTYDSLTKNSEQPWMERLARYRLIKALDSAGQLKRAVEEWLATIDESGKDAVGLRPKKIGEKGSKENDEAIAILEAKRKSIGDKAAAAAVRQMLIELYGKQGKSQETAALAAEAAGIEPATEQVADNVPGEELAESGASMKAMETLVQQGQAVRVAKEISSNLHRYSRYELPAALCLLGKAQESMAAAAKDEKEKSKLLAQAGLSYMRVVTYFSGSNKEAAESMLGAARVNRAMGNTGAAMAAYEEVTRRYSEGSQRALGEQARAALEELKKSSPASQPAKS